MSPQETSLAENPFFSQIMGCSLTQLLHNCFNFLNIFLWYNIFFLSGGHSEASGNQILNNLKSVTF